jgi:phosphatidylinositol 4-kinase type 2
MPKIPRSGYARLAQADEEEDSASDNETTYLNGNTTIVSTPGGTRYAPVQPERRHDRMQANGRASPSRRRMKARSNSGVDIKAINQRLERWADEIASKFKLRRGKHAVDEEQPEIQHSVFQAPDWIRPATAEALQDESATSGGPITKAEFEDAVESVRVAIEMGTHPTLISQGSSGSYFARNSQGKILAVFKPKDEEPYASKNPKWTKWIHRNLFPFFFGRACLIPNLSYISEAAAFVLDQRLQINIVPYTDIVTLSSKSFSYDFWDRRAYYRKKKALPDKQGSFQMFLKGYKDATQFLKQHPWPDQHNSELNAPRRKKKRRWTEDCRPSGPQESEDEEERSGDSTGRNAPNESDSRRGFWTEKLQQSLREELEKLVILDYIMRNTDRGLDNWMIRIDRKTEEASIVAEAPKDNGNGRQASPNGLLDGSEEPYKRHEAMSAVSRTGTPMNAPPMEDKAFVSLGAIDNSLSWPWKHPDAVSWQFFLPRKMLIYSVALISIWLALPTRLPYRPTLLGENPTPFPPSSHLQSLVGRNTIAITALLYAGCRFPREDVRKTDRSHERTGMERR